MKRILFLFALLMGISSLMAQNPLNAKGDNIVGTYSGKQGDDLFRVKITKLNDGTYRGQIVWMEHDRDAQGNKILDSKNPDKSLRSTPADRIVIFSGLQYNEKKHCWDGTKIYDPQRGMRAKMTARFTDDGRLCVTGSVMMIKESVYWEKVRTKN